MSLADIFLVANIVSIVAVAVILYKYRDLFISL